jgi:hypothetical protein
MYTNKNVATPAIVATISQKYHGKKVHPLLSLNTTDSKTMDNIAQNITMAIPIDTKLKIFVFI